MQNLTLFFNFFKKREQNLLTMSVQEKYSRIVQLSEALGARESFAREENGVFVMGGTVQTPYQKDQIWDAIKAIGGENPSDIIADIRTDVSDYYTKHVVTKNDTLSKIARHYYGDMMKYPVIFDANRNILDNPNVIHDGQVLVIPNL